MCSFHLKKCRLIISLLTGVILPGSTSTMALWIVRPKNKKLMPGFEVNVLVPSWKPGVLLTDTDWLRFLFKLQPQKACLSLVDTWCVHSCFTSRREMNNQGKVTTGECASYFNSSLPKCHTKHILWHKSSHHFHVTVCHFQVLPSYTAAAVPCASGKCMSQCKRRQIIASLTGIIQHIRYTLIAIYYFIINRCMKLYFCWEENMLYDIGLFHDILL